MARPACRIERTAYRAGLEREGWLGHISVDGRSYCLVDRGEGPAMMLLHGLGGSLYDWRHLLGPLSRDHRVLAIDLLGAGDSDHPRREDYSLGAQARRIRGILDEKGVSRATLVGNSYGGGIALRFAQDWPDRVERLVLINSICFPEHIPPYVALSGFPGAERWMERLPFERLARWALRRSYHRAEKLTDLELGTYLEELRAPGRRASLVRILRAILPSDTREFEARLGAIRAPALLLWGREDRVVPVTLGRKLAGTLGQAKLVELDAGHVPHQECPEEVLRLMEGFVS